MTTINKAKLFFLKFMDFFGSELNLLMGYRPSESYFPKLNALKSRCHANRHMYTGNIYKTIWLYIKMDFYNNRTKDFIIHMKGFAPADSKMPYLGGRREVEWDWGWVWVGSGKGVLLLTKPTRPVLPQLYLLQVRQ